MLVSRIGEKRRERSSAVLLRLPPVIDEPLETGLSIKVGELIDAPLCPRGLVLMCGEMGRNSADAADWAKSNHANLMVVSDTELPAGWIRRYAPELDFMLVDADFHGDTEATVDFCIRIRRAAPDLPLILLSSEVSRHDFTCERMMACDATLRPPLMHTALTMGVQAAYQNNAHYLSSIAT